MQTEELKLITNEIVAALKPILQGRNAEDGWMDATRAARYLDLSPNTFDKYRYDEFYSIPGYRVGGKILYKREDLDLWVRLWEAKRAG